MRNPLLRFIVRLNWGLPFLILPRSMAAVIANSVLGKALVGRREQVVIATKFGQVFDEETRQTKGYDTSPEHVRTLL